MYASGTIPTIPLGKSELVLTSPTIIDNGFFYGRKCTDSETLSGGLWADPYPNPFYKDGSRDGDFNDLMSENSWTSKGYKGIYLPGGTGSYINCKQLD